jgi:hypothetical protein
VRNPESFAERRDDARKNKVEQARQARVSPETNAAICATLRDFRRGEVSEAEMAARHQAIEKRARCGIPERVPLQDWKRTGSPRSGSGVSKTPEDRSSE